MLRGSMYGRGRRDGYYRQDWHHSGLPTGRWDWNDARTYKALRLPQPDWDYINSVTDSTRTGDLSRMPGKRYPRSLRVSATGRHVRGIGVVYGDKMLPSRVRANVRIGKGLPQKISHENRSSLVCPAGAQGVVTLISQRLLPDIDRTGVLTGGAVNRQSSSPTNTAGSESVQPEPFDIYQQYKATSSTSPDDVLLTHRNDWTMFTNHSWRDGMAYANGRFTSSLQHATGYLPPYVSNMQDGSMIDLDGTNLSGRAGQSTLTGHEWWKNTDVYHDPVQTFPLGVPGGAGASTTTGQYYPGDGTHFASGKLGVQGASTTDNYYHISEEISWKISNQGNVPTTVTIYEFILNRDVQMASTTSRGYKLDGVWQGGVPVVDGGLPCPIELWRQSREKMFQVRGQPDQVWPADNAIPAGERETVGRTACGLNALPYGRTKATADDAVPTGIAGEIGQIGVDANFVTTASGSATPTDIDYPHVSPKVAPFLHTWYKVKAHTRKLMPGQDTTITVHVRFNKSIPGTWWYQFYGIRDMTRCFTLVSRPDDVVGLSTDAQGATIGPHARMPIMGPSDLMVSWTKKKQFAIAGSRFRGHRYFRSCAVPAFTKLVTRDPVDGDEQEVDMNDGEGEGDE